MPLCQLVCHPGRGTASFCPSPQGPHCPSGAEGQPWGAPEPTHASGPRCTQLSCLLPGQDPVREQVVCGVIKPRSRARPCLFLRAIKSGGWGGMLGAKALPPRGGWGGAATSLPTQGAGPGARSLVVAGGQGTPAGVHLLRIQPQSGVGGTTQDCCQGDRALLVSMATAPLDRSPSLPGCSCPGNPQALLAPAALGHPGFGEGGTTLAGHWGRI